MSYPVKYRVITLALLVTLLLAACASPTPAPTQPPPPTQPPQVVPTKAQPTQPAASADGSWEKVQKAGKLLVGTSADYAPFESYNSKYQIDGFDIALINEVAKQLGVDHTTVIRRIDRLKPDPATGRHAGKSDVKRGAKREEWQDLRRDCGGNENDPDLRPVRDTPTGPVRRPIIFRVERHRCTHAEAKPAVVSAATAEEPVEHARPLGRRDAGAIVADRDQHGIASHRVRSHAHVASGMSGGVRHQVRE